MRMGICQKGKGYNHGNYGENFPKSEINKKLILPWEEVGYNSEEYKRSAHSFVFLAFIRMCFGILTCDCQ